MAITVFVWDMGEKGPDGSIGVGHASMQVGHVYISWWPAEHSASAGLSSVARVHTVQQDIVIDGQPAFASSPIANLDEQEIIAWWNSILDANEDAQCTIKEVSKGYYKFLTNNCSTTVFRALLMGADDKVRALIWASYLSKSASGLAIQRAGAQVWAKLVGGVGTWGSVSARLQSSAFEVVATDIRPPVLVVTPADIMAIVTDIWG